MSLRSRRLCSAAGVRECVRQAGCQRRQERRAERAAASEECLGEWGRAPMMVCRGVFGRARAMGSSERGDESLRAGRREADAPLHRLEKMRAHAVLLLPVAASAPLALCSLLLLCSLCFGLLLRLWRGRRIVELDAAPWTATQGTRPPRGTPEVRVTTTNRGRTRDNNNKRKEREDSDGDAGKVESTSAMRADSLHGDRR